MMRPIYALFLVIGVTWITEEKLNRSMHIIYIFTEIIILCKVKSSICNVQIKRDDAVHDFHRREESIKLQNEQSFNHKSC